MLTSTDNPEVLRKKIKEDIDYFGIEELKKLHKTIATIAAERAIKLADKMWLEKGLSREKIEAEVKKYRQSRQ